MKRHQICRQLLLSILLVLVCWSSAQAFTQVATVVAVRGDVQAIDPAGGIRKLATKTAIFEKDTIKTGERGQVQILFTDNSIISLGRQSEMQVEEYRWQAEQKDGTLKTRIKEGTFRVMGGALATAAPQNFKTETPTATIGIRGSMYGGKVSKETLAVIFLGGKGIDVTNLHGTVAITRPGFGTRVEINKKPLPSIKFLQQDISELNKSLDSTESENDEENSGSSTQEGASNNDEANHDSKAGSGDGEGARDGQESGSSASSGSETNPDTTLSVGLETSEPLAQDTQSSLSPEATFIDPSTSVVPKLQSDVVSDVAQSDLVTVVDESTTINVDMTLSGLNYFFRRDIDLSLPPPSGFQSTLLYYTSGVVAASILENGQIKGTIDDGSTFGPYLISGYDPAATSYPGYAVINDDINFADSILGVIPLQVTTFADKTGQFFYNTYNTAIDGSTKDYLFGSLLFAGTPSASRPTNRIDEFSGHLLHTVPAINEAELELIKIEVNYYNNRLIGRTFSKSPKGGYKDNAILFGTVGSTGTANVTILAGGAPGYLSADVTTAYGSGTGRFYGTFHQGLAFEASGNDYSIITNALGNSWSAAGAAIHSAGSEIITSYPTSVIPFSGFVFGAADDTSTGNVSRIYMNDFSSEFTMTANPTSGVISGSITARELISGATGGLNNLTVGGSASRSAYVLNDQMVAILTGSNLSLRNYGNFLATAGPGAPEITNMVDSEYLTWGTWEMAYTDPGDSSSDHLFSSQSFWVAGQQTPATYMGTNLLGQSIVGTYDGKAFGVQVDALGQNALPLTQGSTHLVIDFSTPRAANAVTGTISFDQAVLNINSAASTLAASGFQANVFDVSGASPIDSAVNGAFYGPTAEAVGGNFRAKMSSGVGYYGIFGGNR